MVRQLQRAPAEPAQTPPALSGLRFGLAVLVAVAASVLAGTGTAAVLSESAPRWSDELDRLAPVVIAAVCTPLSSLRCSSSWAAPGPDAGDREWASGPPYRS